MDANNLEVKESVPASQKLGVVEAKELASSARKVIAFKGKKISEFDSSPNPDKTILDSMLGPTGNLRAPTLVVGKIILIGFNEEEYRRVLL